MSAKKAKHPRSNPMSESDDEDAGATQVNAKRARTARGKSTVPRDDQKNVTMVHTGALPGDIFTGLLSTNAGVQMELLYDADDRYTQWCLRPGHDSVDHLRSESRLCERLMQLPRFRDMATLEEALQSIQARALPPDHALGRRHLNAVERLRVRFLHLGYFDERATSKRRSLLADPARVDAETQAWLLSGPLLYSEVVERLPFLAKGGDDGSLFSDYYQWTPYSGDQVVTLPAGVSKGRPPMIRSDGGQIVLDTDDWNGEGRVLRKVLDDARVLHIILPQHAPIAPETRRVLRAFVLQVWNGFRELFADDPRHMAHVAISNTELNHVIAICGDMSASELKSLIQKAIRFGATHTLLPALGDFPNTMNRLPNTNGIKVRTTALLLVAMVTLARLPGYFLPELGAYVTGVHSLAKRLLVILGEDATPNSFVQWDLLELATCALLSSDDVRWFPTMAQLISWICLAMNAQVGASCYRFDIGKGKEQPPYILNESLVASRDYMGVVSAMLDTIGSFEGDKALFRNIARDSLHAPQTAMDARAEDAPPTIMPLWHYCDHHISGNILYFLDPDAVTNLARAHPGGAPSGNAFYAMLFDALFEVTGANPRRHPDGERLYVRDQTDAWWQAVRAAQYTYFVATHSRRTGSLVGPCITNATRRTLKDTIDAQWLAALVGDCKFTVGAVAYFAALDVNDPTPGAIVATRRPGRDGNDTVDETKRQEAITMLREQLEGDGVVLNKCDPPHPSLKGAVLRLDRPVVGDDKQWRYVVRRPALNETLFVGLKEALALEIAVPAFELSELPVRIEKIIRDRAWMDKLFSSVRPTYCMSANDVCFERLLSAAPRTARVRLYQWLAVARGNTFTIPTISRTMSATNAAAQTMGRPMPVDIQYVFRELLVPLLYLYPAALQIADCSVTTFHVHDPAVLNHIRTLVAASLNEPRGADSARASPWANVADTMPQRRVIPYQQEAIECLSSEHAERGVLRKLLWMPPGSGKTYIVLSTWCAMVRSGQPVPDYIIYTVPRSAFATILKEARYFKFNVVWGDSASDVAAKIANAKQCAPGSLILLEHDWLRQGCVVDAIESILPRSFCFFDEMHKMLNFTQRSSFGRSMATSCQGFVAFTGTPVTSNDPLMLAAWLTLVLPYHVTRANIWASMGAFLRIESTFDVVMAQHLLDGDAALLSDPDYRRLVRPLTEGTKFGPGDFNKLLKRALTVVQQRVLVPAVLQEIALPTRVPADKQHAHAPRRTRACMVIVSSTSDQEPVRQLFLDAAGGTLKEDDILLFGQFDKKKASQVLKRGVDATESDYNAAYGLVDFTDESVATRASRDYRIIIVPQSRDTGYSLSRCEHVFTAPFPSNEATRTQLRDRIRRVDQLAPVVECTVVVGGILTRIHTNQREAQSVAAALRMLTARA